MNALAYGTIVTGATYAVFVIVTEVRRALKPGSAVRQLIATWFEKE